MPTCYALQLSGFESRHLSKVQNGRHEQRSGQHTLARQNYTNIKFFLSLEFILFLFITSPLFFSPENVTCSSVVCCDVNAYCAQKLCTIKSLILFVISFRLVMSLGTASAVLQPDGTRYYIKPKPLPPLKGLSREIWIWLLRTCMVSSRPK